MYNLTVAPKAKEITWQSTNHVHHPLLPTRVIKCVVKCAKLSLSVLNWKEEEWGNCRLCSCHRTDPRDRSSLVRCRWRDIEVPAVWCSDLPHFQKFNILVTHYPGITVMCCRQGWNWCDCPSKLPAGEEGCFVFMGWYHENIAQHKGDSTRRKVLTMRTTLTTRGVSTEKSESGL